MTHAPFAAERRGTLLFGRGAADMKSGLAAMCAAAARAHAADAIAGEGIVAAVVDEEMESAGTRALLERGVVKAAQKFYVSLAHSEEDLQRTVQVFTAALEAVAEQRP
jgi:acetylornithine deacetylase/succinyl-diaminopimelate desuccinylase-like protein